jgi:hypothetical protein
MTLPLIYINHQTLSLDEVFLLIFNKTFPPSTLNEVFFNQPLLMSFISFKVYPQKLIELIESTPIGQLNLSRFEANKKSVFHCAITENNAKLFEVLAKKEPSFSNLITYQNDDVPHSILETAIIISSKEIIKIILNYDFDLHAIIRNDLNALEYSLILRPHLVDLFLPHYDTSYIKDLNNNLDKYLDPKEIKNIEPTLLSFIENHDLEHAIKFPNLEKNKINKL